MKEYTCDSCGETLTGYKSYKNHICGSQERLNDTIEGVEKLSGFDIPENDTPKTRQTSINGGEF